jgi:hypothetical protein
MLNKSFKIYVVRLFLLFLHIINLLRFFYNENAYLNISYILDHERKLSKLLGTPFDINIGNFFMRKINAKIKYKITSLQFIYLW